MELNTLREVAAKAATDLAHVTQKLEKQKKRNNASKAATPVTSPANAASKLKKSAANIRRTQVLSYEKKIETCFMNKL